MKSLKILPVFTYLGIFLFFCGVSYLIFSKLSPASSPAASSKPKQPVSSPMPTQKPGVLVFSGPKTEICPLNGDLFTKEEKDIWSQRRPLTVMIENHADSRPQSGLENADVVYEAVAEGGITRFMGVFYCNAVKEATNKYDVGPVRSARTYFVDLASEYADYPLYTHVGGANCSAPLDPNTGLNAGPCTTNKKAQAVEQIASYGWNNKGTWGDLSQFSLSYKVCRREPERTGSVKDTEHTMYCSTKELWNVAASRGLTNITEINKSSWDKSFKTWSFKQKDQPASAIDARLISFDFWPGYKDYSVTWTYDSTKKFYSRSHSSQPHLDFNTSEPLTAKNIIIQLAKETRSIDTHLHNLYDVVGSGKGYLFQNGTRTEITWSKSTRTSRTIYKDSTGKEINFVPGRIWVEILPSTSSVNYES